jgi:phenylalanyl-tRNA synthetase beta chain
MRPISNVVDISNFVMMELGQPLHHFDYAKIRGRQIIVRRATPGEKFTTLDDQERVLDQDVLVIADGEGPVAMAGVMGGLESEVTDATTDILIESAHFDNINNRRTALRYNLPSEAARRFTKGVDPSGAVRAADRAAQLLAALAGGSVIQGHVDELPFSQAWETRYTNMRKRNWMKTGKCARCRHWKNCNGSSLHLWDWEKNETKVCHYELLHGDGA